MALKLIEWKQYLCTRKDYSDQQVLIEKEAFALDRRLWWVDERIKVGHSPLAELTITLPWMGFEKQALIYHPQQLVGVFVTLPVKGE